jgi:two-component system sensor histidine kinase TctE
MTATETANELFDRTLLSAALAISRDVMVSDGDALLPSTLGLIHDASGGKIFYHVTGPAGVYITGYAYPPVLSENPPSPNSQLQYYKASYRLEPVQVLRLTEKPGATPLLGNLTVTVWQRISDRNAFAQRLFQRTTVLLGILLAALTIVVWFGVKLGLRPLHDLHDAIAKRSPDDLSQIKRPVPIEAQGIVAVLNRLFKQVEDNIAAHQAFISDAAHQLKNPTAGLLAMAQATSDTKDEAERKKRLGELVEAARNTARVTNQLLSLERLQHGADRLGSERIDLNTLAESVCAGFAQEALKRSVNFEFVAKQPVIMVQANSVFLAEALKNLLNNALSHAGPNLGAIVVTTATADNTATLTVWDDGKPLAPHQEATLFRRFSQLEPNPGSGLGLAIADTVARQHKGRLKIDAVETGASITIQLPLANSITD